MGRGCSLCRRNIVSAINRSIEQGAFKSTEDLEAMDSESLELRLIKFDTMKILCEKIEPSSVREAVRLISAGMQKYPDHPELYRLHELLRRNVQRRCDLVTAKFFG